MAAQTVSKGLSTWAGLIAAAGQYAGAVAVFLNDPDKATALGPLTTATATLLVVIIGRMQQAVEVTKRQPGPSSGVSYTASSTPGVTATGLPSVIPGTIGAPRPSVEGGIQMPPVDVARRAPELQTIQGPPFTPDGDPNDGEGDDEARLASLPDESWIADPHDSGGAQDRPETDS